MADLADGESMEMQGSGSRPYVLKNIGGVYSCSCPAWRNQSLAIEKRSCKHVRRLRGEEAEVARIGTALPNSTAKCKGASDKKVPPLLLAETWDGEADPTGWFLSEKLDGVRAYWNGSQFRSRLGNIFHAPDWFVAGLPREPLDGELWIRRKCFQRTVSIVRRQDKSELWKEVRYLIFDAPNAGTAFEHRLKTIDRILQTNRAPFAHALQHSTCIDADHLRTELARVNSLGGEGLMLRQPGSIYQAGRSSTLLKVKSFHDSEALVIGHEAGQGRHQGRLGALLVELPEGIRIAVGTGLSNAERNCPPPVGSLITFKYQELTDGGVPRFPSCMGIRALANSSTMSPVMNGPITMSKTSTKATRRFEFVAGTSDKFWEVSSAGTSVTVRFGRNGTSGQASVKEFADAAKAQQQVEKLIAEKLG